jgi:methylmalonyl-CoA mutase N-terminal domain/subunit
MAYGFCIAKAYIDLVLSRGLDIDEFASRLSFNFDIHGNFFEQICKFRAGRRLWASIVRDTYKAKDPKSMWLRMIAGGGGGGLTIEQPENNIVRGAYYALISALSGTQTMALCSFDEAYTIPSERAARISLRTMQILIEEMGLGDTVDPLGGSYYVEAMTDEMEQRIEAVMADVDAKGGIVSAIAEGHIQNAVSRQAYEHHRKMESGEIRKVGVNCYQVDEEQADIEFHPVNEEECGAKIVRLKTIRAERDSSCVAQALNDVRNAAKTGDNVMPAIIAAVSAYATVGEITDCLVDVYGRFPEPIRF